MDLGKGRIGGIFTIYRADGVTQASYPKSLSLGFLICKWARQQLHEVRIRIRNNKCDGLSDSLFQLRAWSHGGEIQPSIRLCGGACLGFSVSAPAPLTQRYMRTAFSSALSKIIF